MTKNESLYKQFNNSLRDNYEPNKKLGLDLFFKSIRKYFLNITNVEKAVNDLLIYNELDSEDKIKDYYKKILNKKPKSKTLDSDFFNEQLDEFYKKINYKAFKLMLDERDLIYKTILEDIKTNKTRYKKLVNLVTSTNGLKGTNGVIMDYLLDKERFDYNYVYFKRTDEDDPDIFFLDALFINSLDLEQYERIFNRLVINYIKDKLDVSQDKIVNYTANYEFKDLVKAVELNYKDTTDIFAILTANNVYNKIRVNMMTINIGLLELRDKQALEEQKRQYRTDLIPLPLGLDDTWSYIDSDEINANALVPIKHSLPSNTELTPKLLEKLDIETKGDLQAFNLDYELVKKDDPKTKLDDLDDFVLNTICCTLFLDKGRTVFNDRYIAKAWTRKTGHEKAEQTIIEEVNNAIEKLSSTTFNYYLESKQSRNGLKIAKQRRSGKYINVKIVELERLLTDEELKKQVTDNDLNESKYFKTIWYQLTGGNYLDYLQDTGIKPNRVDRSLLYNNIPNVNKGYKDQKLRTHIIKAIDRAFRSNETAVALNLEDLCKVYGYDFIKNDNKERQRIKIRAELIINENAIKYKLHKYIKDEDIEKEKDKLTQYVQETRDKTSKITGLIIEFDKKQN